MIVPCTVCEAEIPSIEAASTLEVDDERYYFCSDHCRRVFDEEPWIFVEETDERLGETGDAGAV